jgi:hypothetical protein
MASLSGGSGSQSNGQDGQNNNGSSSNNGTNADGDGGGPNGNDGQYQTFNLPPLTIGILATMTVITISGSAFWLRKRNNINA